jgi:hypothetical protein
MNKQEKHEIINEFAKDIKGEYATILDMSKEEEFVKNMSKDFIDGFVSGAKCLRDMLIESAQIEHLCVEAGIKNINESREAYQKFLEAHHKYLNRIEDGEWK